MRRTSKGDMEDDELTEDQKLKLDREAQKMAEAYLREFGDDDDDADYYDAEDDDTEEGGSPFSKVEANWVADEDEEEAKDATQTGKKDEAKITLSQQRRKDKRLAKKAQVPIHLLPKIAVVGRPNVGKSSLFNKLAGSKAAIVHDTPGVTRDRLYVRGFWGAEDFLLIDTGGLIDPSEAEKQGVTLPDHAEDPGTKRSAELIPGMIETQAIAAVEEADAIIAVVDGQSGPCASDEDILRFLRRRYPNKPVLLAVNKCESQTAGLTQAAAFWEFGYDPIAVSALNGTGTGELLDELMAVLPKKAPPVEEWTHMAVEDDPIRVAIIGRPNVGKSSLVNAILGEERTIVSKMSGTTRDVIDSPFTDSTGQKYVLVDTAGIRKRSKVVGKKDVPEQLSVQRALKAARRADVAVLVLDALEGPTEQDFRLADRIGMDGRACVIVLNKWDLVPDKDGSTMTDYENNFTKRMRNVAWAPRVFTCATSGQRVKDVLDKVRGVGAQHRKRISTSTLNMVVRDACLVRQPPIAGGRAGRIYYATQAATRPPTFVMFTNDASMFNEMYRRFIERQLREQIGFEGTPIRVLWRSKPTKKTVVSNWTKGGAPSYAGGTSGKAYAG